ncbi:response regulator [Halonatronum saccharophilum]|uniref:response regulator n=1 Tax=Halonatronum saccharophilum TaxID=150060 RepID=UPI000488232C|nr:response regulator [Halonatronum saccharophilum]
MNKILIIDDEKNIRLTLKSCLADDYEIVTAVNGEDGLVKVEENGDIDLILLDMKLPGINGMEVLKRVRDLKEDIDVIMITGFGSIETAVEAMKLGAVDYLRKPFTPDEIKDIVESVLKRRRLNIAEDKPNTYEDYLEHSKLAINRRDFKKAYKYLQEGVGLDPSKPEAFNLMGVILEMEDDPLEAQKKYRAALALDPSYRPAQDNLERTTQFEYNKQGINLGDKEE